MIAQVVINQTTREHPYYRINVRNFSVFYVVIDDTMEVRRLLYSKRNIDVLLE
ncbi:hypothetical protein HMPREF1576_01431 [Gardnerella pickettii JCP7719]|uniref:Toxin-antitoxin system, toxin component, RelE domain protein n=1 Tax=Gardnerella pickettii JCP7719 TaxID=1261061 RepID=S4GK00_9BIFI|nr:hypothetical protein HMPREF1576_01431 [Gardnerella pickettii JCP7719]